jgi:hypothetical protein
MKPGMQSSKRLDLLQIGGIEDQAMDLSLLRITGSLRCQDRCTGLSYTVLYQRS